MNIKRNDQNEFAMLAKGIFGVWLEMVKVFWPVIVAGVFAFIAMVTVVLILVKEVFF